MSATLSQSYGLSSALKIEAEDLVGKKQGIVSILGADSDRPTKPASLRRTLSADMSSKKWLSQNGFSPMKRIASSEEFHVEMTDSSEEDEEEFGDKNENKKEQDSTGQLDLWSLIISQKSKEDSSKSLPPPYIHPLVKRSASSLSEKSLEICTESLGSETGSEGFSSYPPSETGDVEEDHEYSKQGQSFSFEQEEPRIVKYNNYVNCGRRSGQARSFPPPIPSLARHDGASVRMKTHRDNGRLVMEAVSIPSQNNFRAQRQDGRLVLTFASSPTLDETDDKDEEIDDEDEEGSAEDMDLEFDSFGDEEEAEVAVVVEESEDEFEIEKFGEFEEESETVDEYEGAEEASFVNRLPTLPKYKPISFTNRNPTWPKRFNEIVKLGDKLDDEKAAETIIQPLAQSLPLRPKAASLIPAPPAAAGGAAASYNAYEYYWRPKPMQKSGGGLNCMEQNPQGLKSNQNNLVLSKDTVANEQQELVVLRGQKGDYLVSLFKGCKEPRRSLLSWEPHCIATS